MNLSKAQHSKPQAIERTIIEGGQLARQVQVELDHVLRRKTRH